MRTRHVAAIAALLACAVVGFLAVGDTSSSQASTTQQDLPITIVSSSADTLVVSFVPPPNAIGYAFKVDGARVSNTWDASRTGAKFHLLPSPPSHVYGVAAVVEGVTGAITFPIPAPTTTTAPTTTQPPTTTATTTTTTPSTAMGAKLPARMPESSGASTLIVSATGSGSSCTASAPCAFNTAWTQATSGTTIQLRAGSYGGYYVVQGKRYSATNPVTLESYPGEMATFTGCPSSCAQNVLYFGDDLGIRLRRFAVTGRYNVGAGVKVEDSSYVDIDHLTVSGTLGNGLLVNGVTQSGFHSTFNDHVQVWNSTFSDNGVAGPDGNGGPHSVYMGGGTAFDGNKHGVDGFVVVNNLFYGQPTGFQLQVGDQAVNGIVANNTFDDIQGDVSYHGSAIVLWGQGSLSPTSNVVVTNNLLTHASLHGTDGVGETLTGIDVHANLAFGNGSSDYNGRYGTITVYTPGVNYPPADPLYVNRVGRDYHLSPGSPALNRGDTAYMAPRDADGNARLVPTLGAFS